MNGAQRERMVSAPGFVAAVDQSGGSTPGALAAFGIGPDRYSNDETMYDLMHAMRARIIMSPAFDHRVIGAILFEMTMDRLVEGVHTAEYLWTRKQVVPFLKVDKGLLDEVDGAQVMKPNPGLGALLERARDRGIFGTKMRSVIGQANPAGVEAVVEQQFAVGLEILDAGLMPIIEPEVSIGCPDKAQAESLLRERVFEHLGRLGPDQQVMLKLTLPDVDGFYTDLITDARVLRVVALSGGYSRDDANARLARNPGMIASFSRALVEGLSDAQDSAAFDATLGRSIASIVAASVT